MSHFGKNWANVFALAKPPEAKNFPHRLQIPILKAARRPCRHVWVLVHPWALEKSVWLWSLIEGHPCRKGESGWIQVYCFGLINKIPIKTAIFS